MAETSRLTGIGRLKTMRSLSACWRMKLLVSSVNLRPSLQEQGGVPQNACVRRQSCDRDTDVVIYPKHLLLV